MATTSKFHPTESSVPPAGAVNVQLKEAKGFPVHVQPLVRLYCL